MINNAGIAHVGNVLETTASDIDRLHAVNVRGVFHGLHFGIEKMRAVGAIVNICSVAAKLGISDRFAYSMT
jgi:2-keto-3-deoxy-L-fuconate dehydrogenase